MRIIIHIRNRIPNRTSSARNLSIISVSHNEHNAHIRYNSKSELQLYVVNNYKKLKCEVWNISSLYETSDIQK